MIFKSKKINMQNENDLVIIQNKIFEIRNVQVMLDIDLSILYGVETKVLNQAVKRNIERFPDSFRFQLTEKEYDNCSRSQIVTLNDYSKGKRGLNIKYRPYAYTEQGIPAGADIYPCLTQRVKRSKKSLRDRCF